MLKHLCSCKGSNLEKDMEKICEFTRRRAIKFFNCAGDGSSDGVSQDQLITLFCTKKFSTTDWELIPRNAEFNYEYSNKIDLIRRNFSKIVAEMIIKKALQDGVQQALADGEYAEVTISEDGMTFSIEFSIE